MALYNLYLICTLLPLSIYVIEKILPYEILDSITYYPDSINLNPFNGAYISLMIIGLSYFILRSINRKRYLFIISIKPKIVYLLTFYCLIRFFAAYRFFDLTAGLDRTQIQFIEASSRVGIKGVITYGINILYPLVISLISSTLINANQLYKKKTLFKFLFSSMLLILGVTAILNDYTRSSRGNLFLFFTAIFSSYLVTYNYGAPTFSFQNLLKKKFLFNLCKGLVLLSLIFFSFINLSYVRVSKDSSTDYLSGLRIIPLLHDATVLKAVGGQMVTNLALTDQLYVAPGVDNIIAGQRVRKVLFSEQLPRDIYCEEYNCLNLFQPLNLINKLFNDVKDLPMYFPILGISPYNSSNHIASLCIVFGRSLGIISYLAILFLFTLVLKINTPYLQWIGTLILTIFCLNAFTDNYLITYYPITLILAIPLLKLTGCKVKRVKCNSNNKFNK